MDDLDNNPDGLWETMGLAAEAVGALVSFRSLLMEFCTKLADEYYRRIPRVEEIEQSVYQSLMADFK